MPSDPISISDAAKAGIERIRQPQWANPLDHVKLDLVNGGFGPWLHLFAPFNRECNGRDPVEMLFIQVDTQAKEWLPYVGPLPDSDEYRASQESYIRIGASDAE